MKVIYHDKKGRHLPIIAASLHLQTLKTDFTNDELYNLPYFMKPKEEGVLMYLGLDSQGNEIYVLGRGKAFPIIRNATVGLNKTFNFNQDFVFADVDPVANWRLKIFDLVNAKSAENTRLTGFAHTGIKKAIPGVVKLVEEVQKQVRHGEGWV